MDFLLQLQSRYYSYNAIPCRKSSFANMQVDMKTVFPLLLIILDLCAAGVYWYYGDVRHVVYWVSAAALTWAVTF